MGSLYKKNPYRIHPIIKIVDGKIIQADTKEGVAIERLDASVKTEKSYYVLAFIWWDKGAVKYDPLLNRVLDDQLENPEYVYLFEEMLKKAKNIVYNANN